MRTDSKTSRTAIVFVVLSFLMTFLSLALENISNTARDVGWGIAVLLFVIGLVFWIRNKR